MGNFLREAVELDDIIVFKFSALFLKLFDLGQVLARFTLLDHRVKSGYLTFSVKDSATEVLFGVGHAQRASVSPSPHESLRAAECLGARHGSL